MSEKNWPVPTKLFFNWDVYAWQSYGGDLYTPDSYEKKDLEVYTAAQVREIVAAEVPAVRAELAEDAERFAFLASNPYWDGHAWWAPDIFICADPKEPSIKGLRAAIDAARAAKGGEP